MDGSNLLSGGVDELNEIKECLLELYGFQANSDSLHLEKETLENSIGDLEKGIAEEIQRTTTKRRKEIEETFDTQLDKIHTGIKRIKEKREKRKNVKVSQRMDTETSSLRTENAGLKHEAKSLLKQKHVPRFCNTKLYYALYSPACFTDYLVIIGMLLLVLLLVPCGIYFLLLPQEKIPYLILTYIATVIFFGGIYIIFGSRTKERFTEELQKVKGIRRQIRANKRKMAVIRNNIRKDRDESAYGLQDYDDELAGLEQETAEISDQKKEALASFDNSTSRIIAGEIEKNHKDKLAALRAEYDKTSTALEKAEEKVKALTIKAAGEYEPFVGKEFMLPQRLDTLINIIRAGNASTVSEAITFYKKSMEEKEDTTV